MSRTLVILAAGMGRRYGGLKQLDPVGPAGETLLDYAVFDAVRNGFDRIVFVIRHEFEAEFRRVVVRRYVDAIPLDVVFQAGDDLPAGIAGTVARDKPWGTGHAVWCARSAIEGPFAVINADDFYGRDSFTQIAGLLRADANVGTPLFGLVGFRLDQTLSEHGAVSRGVCTVNPAGLLQRVVERAGIRAEDVGPGRTFTGEEPVSMNCWAFTPAIFPLLEQRLVSFLRAEAHDLGAEFYLPAAVSELVNQGQATVRVLPTRARWFGVTYREDAPVVALAIRQMIAAGEYPPALQLPSLSPTA